MIHHISIPATNPKHVADVLAELMDGRAYPFPGGIPDSFMAVSGDRHGTMIEVYPPDMTLEPNGTPQRKPGQKPLFHLVEVWVEDHFMLEVAPQSMVGDYEKLVQFEVIDQLMAAQPH
jgi:hypothetical protein